MTTRSITIIYMYICSLPLTLALWHMAIKPRDSISMFLTPLSWSSRSQLCLSSSSCSQKAPSIRPWPWRKYIPWYNMSLNVPHTDVVQLPQPTLFVFILVLLEGTVFPTLTLNEMSNIIKYESKCNAVMRFLCQRFMKLVPSLNVNWFSKARTNIRRELYTSWFNMNEVLERVVYNFTFEIN